MLYLFLVVAQGSSLTIKLGGKTAFRITAVNSISQMSLLFCSKVSHKWFRTHNQNLAFEIQAINKSETQWHRRTLPALFPGGTYALPEAELLEK